MKIRTKLTVTAVINGALIVALSGFTFVGIRSINNDFEQVAEDTTPAIILLTQMDHEFFESVESAYSYITLGEPRYKQEFFESSEHFDAIENSFRQLINTESSSSELAQNTAFIEQIRAVKTGYLSSVERMFTAYEQHPDEHLDHEIVHQFIIQTDRMIPVLNDFIKLEESEVRLAQEDAKRTVGWVNSVVIYLGLFLLVFGMVVNWWIARGIGRPLAIMTEAAKSIRAGNYQIQADIASHDEFGELAVAYNETVKKLADEPSRLDTKVKERTAELETLKESLEKMVGERTRELQDKVDELKRMNEVMIDRELKMIELKEEAARLRERPEQILASATQAQQEPPLT